MCQRHQKIGKMKAKELRYFLFSHAFTRCNTTSAIHDIGRVSIFKNLQNVHLAKIANVLYKGGNLPEDIEHAVIFDLLHSSLRGNLHQIRYRKYEEIVIVNHEKIDPSFLPPSLSAAYFHELRVYHQLQVWIGWNDMDLKPC